MTRTYLLQVAESIKKTAIPKFLDPLAPALGTTYETKFLGNKILLYVNSRGEPLAIYHKKVMYVFSTTSTQRVHIMKDFYEALNCNTKVFLYNNDKHISFRDDEGTVHYDNSSNPMYGDYSTLIPLPHA